MIIADAHCDTLTAYKDDAFYSKKAHWNLPKFQALGGVLQYFAIFTDTEYSGDSALRYAFSMIGRFAKQKPQEVKLLLQKSDYDSEKVNILLSLEGASPIINDINNLYAFYAAGVRAMTLTWNHRNFVADGVSEPYGLTKFGREVITEMEKLKMIIDVSHLNTKGFEDVFNTVQCPIIASHSNARAICDHQRNLNDEQIKEIINRKGFIGINLYSYFLGKDGEDLKANLIKHIEHILNLGGEDVLGLGADFDGIELCPFKDIDAYPEIYSIMKQQMNLTDDLIEKIMHKNLVDFTLNYLN